MKLDINITGIIFTILSALLTIVLMPDNLSIYKYVLLGISAIILIAFLFSYLSHLFGLKFLIKRLKQTYELGILQIKNSGNTNSEEFLNHIDKASEVKILAISANGLLKNLNPQLKKLLLRNGTIKIMISQPGSKVISQVEDLSSHFHRNTISQEINQARNLLYDLYFETKTENKDKQIGQIFIGLFDTHYKLPIVIIDDKFGQVNLTLPPKRARNSATIEVVKKDNGILEDLIKHFDAIWTYLETNNNIERIDFIEKPKRLFINPEQHNCPSCSIENSKYKIIYCFNYSSIIKEHLFGFLTECDNCGNKLVNISHSQIIYNVDEKFYFSDYIDIGNIDKLIFNSTNILEYIEIIEVPENIKEKVKKIALNTN